MKYYVLLELGWEYNDEYYYRTEYDDGRPKAVFTNKKEAEIESVKRTLKYISELDVEFLLDSYSVIGWGNSEQKLQEFSERFPTITSKTKIKNIPTDIQENLVNWLEEIDIKFYEIVTIKQT